MKRSTSRGPDWGILSDRSDRAQYAVHCFEAITSLETTA
jgi:hypothetical protein